ncbi:MAG: alpha-1,2-fucosyltransferase [Anditalea sp.]
MKVVKFLGGLGNQMFQFAFYLSLKQHFGKVKADLTGFEDYSLHYGFELEKVFPIQLEKASPFELRIYGQERRDWITRKLRRIYNTKHAWHPEKEEFGFDPLIYQDSSPRYFWGYWQHCLYHQAITPQLRKAFEFKRKLEGKNLAVGQQVKKTPSVSIHVRRGDYLDHPILGDICNLDYYQKGIEVMKEKVENPQFVVFSNDIAWCRSNLSLSEAIFVDWNKGENSHRDMQLMALCRHHIIANSSFSWWGAWLNPHGEKIVVSPEKWINTPGVDTSGLIHHKWITI